MPTAIINKTDCRKQIKIVLFAPLKSIFFSSNKINTEEKVFLVSILKLGFNGNKKALLGEAKISHRQNHVEFEILIEINKTHQY